MNSRISRARTSSCPASSLRRSAGLLIVSRYMGGGGPPIRLARLPAWPICTVPARWGRHHVALLVCRERQAFGPPAVVVGREAGPAQVADGQDHEATGGVEPVVVGGDHDGPQRAERVDRDEDLGPPTPQA